MPYIIFIDGFCFCQALNVVLKDEALYEQDAAIESAILQEEGYLREIEQAEREEMPHELLQEAAEAEDEEEEDPELGVTLRL